ncbi:helix-turn-helix domain-containing protein, partial [Rhodobacterales bacterium HKCCE3408]|nr:helix-turn-helix domain-containing protein [Rhodobacterales bacterium HKCCE3408]
MTRQSRQTRSGQTGSRIRDRRSALGLKQADLARDVGISPSYLNLIEHDRRRIGGKLLVDIARVLKVEPAILSEGAEAAITESLRAVAAGMGRSGSGPMPETDRIDALVARFPGWARALAEQQRRIAARDAVVAGLRDRLRHDPVLAEAMHEMLSGVSAIRATAGILAEDRALDPQWTARFHRNLNEEAERLSDRATALLRHFEVAETTGVEAAPGTLPEDAVEALLDRAGHHFPAIEARGAEAIDDVLGGAEGLPDGPARDLARATLAAYAADAARLPIDRFAPAAEAAEYRPEPLYAMAGGDVALVLRRMATLPPGAPDFGLATV